MIVILRQDNIQKNDSGNGIVIQPWNQLKNYIDTAIQRVNANISILISVFRGAIEAHLIARQQRITLRRSLLIIGYYSEIVYYG